MSDRKPLWSRQLDRRAFLGGAAFAAGVVVATALVPLSIVHAVPTRASIALTPAPDDPSWNGHVDDAWGHSPPYAHPIPYNAMRPVFAANVAAADSFLMMV